MKQRKVVSMIGALVVMISAAVFITGCQQANGGKSGNGDILKKGIIEFDAASVKCQNTKSYTYTDVTSGGTIQEKDELKFEAILLSGTVVENWYINDVKQEYETDSKMFYTVKASDIVGGKLKISIVLKDAVQGNIEFDSTIIKCQNTKSYTYTDVTSGGTIQEKDELKFEAILLSGTVVENWYINDVKQEYETDSKMFYTVKASDIVGGKLKISIVLKDAVQGNIEFDSTIIKCQNTKSYPYTDVTTGSKIQEKDELKFEAILPTDKIVKNWYINDVKQEYKTDSKMFYTVKASDIVGNKLKVSVITKDAVQGTVEFDVASVKCQKTNSFPYTDVTSGSQIQEKDELYFKAILPTGKVVENWYINDVKQEYKTGIEMFYTVKESDIVGGKLKVSVVFK